MPRKADILTQAKSDMMSNLPNLDTIRKSISLLSKDNREKVREDVMKTVVAINELEVLENVMLESKTSFKSEFGHKHSPEVAENSFEAILTFNDDMKVLAMNAYQM